MTEIAKRVYFKDVKMELTENTFQLTYSEQSDTPVPNPKKYHLKTQRPENLPIEVFYKEIRDALHVAVDNIMDDSFPEFINSLKKEA